MFIYMGAACPYCGQVLTEEDDIAVCPECGTPHHRSCYLEHGRCFNEEKHSEGFEWKNVNAVPQLPPNALEDLLVCPVCGAENDPHAEECSECGYRFRSRTPDFSRGESGSGPVRIEISLNEKIEGVPVKDYLVYLGRGSVRHILAFKRQEESGSKFGFSLPALISPVLFFIYYRMWAMAVPMAIITLLLNTPSFIVMYFGEAMSSFMGYSMQQWNSAGNICSIILTVIQVICAFFSVYLLKTSSAKSIKKLRRACDNEEDYARLLTRKACPSVFFYIIIGLSFVSLMISLISL